VAEALEATTPETLAPIATTSFFAMAKEAGKRYSGKRETAPNKNHDNRKTVWFFAIKNRKFAA
jgi:hypothetical protein